MNIRTDLVECDTSNRMLRHHLGKRVPRSNIKPCITITLHNNTRFLFNDCIIKTDFGQLLITIKESLIK